MTKKHFIALAKALKTERPGENWDSNKKVQWDLCVKAVANVCAGENGLFSRERFITACGELFNV